MSVKGKSKAIWIQRILLYAALSIIGLLVMFPFIWMISTAFKVKGYALKFQLFPHNLNDLQTMFTIRNFIDVWQGMEFSMYFLNSMFVAGMAAFFATFFASLAGYAFAKKDFWAKEKIYYLLLSTMMIPGMMYMIPQFVIVVKLGWYNTYKAMIIPHLASVFGVLLLRQFIETIPESLLEAARIDGASEWQIFRKVIVPLAFPVIATLFLMTFLFHWSNFLWQLVVSDPGLTRNIRTLPVGLALFRGPHGNEWELMMAASCFSILPIAVLFWFAQRFFIEGMTQGAVKE
ncbi:MAG: carbohydrate ABC transporter permease [Candidatus Wallbacteria bacterium]|nr:carbohydrate ABC transporter permease [Candidatus Wallbacteria bacterium]